MKKFIPYIFITGFIGAFLAVSFVAPFSGISSVSHTAEAQQTDSGQVGPRVADDTSKKTIEITTSGDLNEFIQSSGAPVSNTSNAGTSWSAKIVDASIGYGLSLMASLVYSVSGMILNMSAFLMEKVIHFTVINFKANIENIGVIDIGYKIILNVANMIFIFILLYMAIKMILGEGGDVKKLLAKVVMVALFINFSLFMTKVIIDASNIMSLGFLNAIKTEVGVDKETKKTRVAVGSVATAWMSGLRLQTEAYNPNADVIKNDPFKGYHYVTMTLQYLGGSALNLVTAFVFFAVSFLFVTRFIALLFYMIFSPVAFLGYIAPELQKYSSDWWKGFQSQVIFAPAFLLIAYLIASIIKSNKLWGVVGGTDGPNSGFLTAIGTGFTSGFPIIMNYVILIALMIGGLITAKKMASEGSAGMVAYADKARGWMQGVAGRNTIGRAAYLASKSEFVNNLAAKSPTFGGFAKARLEGVANREFGKGSGKGYGDTLKESIKRKKEMADSIAKSKTREVDKSIREEQSLVNEREGLQFDLSNEVLKSQKIVDDMTNEHEVFIKSIENLEKSRAKYAELFAKSSLSMNPADMAVTDLAEQEMDRDEANLENEKINLRGRGIDPDRTEATIADEKLNLNRNTKNLEKHKSETAKIQKGLGNLIKQRDNTRDKMKREYAKNLPFAELGKSLWGDNLAFLDEIFPSYTDAANEIRKAKSVGEKEISELMKKLVDEEVKKRTAGGATTP